LDARRARPWRPAGVLDASSEGAVKTALERFNALILTFMFLTTLFQVVARTILGVSSVWSEELARFLYVCIVFLGAALLARDDEHIRVAVITDRVGKRAAALLRFLTVLLTIPFIAVMTLGSWTNTRLNWKTYAPTLDWLSIGYIYLMIFLTGILMLGYLVANLLRLARDIVGRAPGTAGEIP
jgi:TRAP-type C4-dicarboxylate transport system permease small subunit